MRAETKQNTDKNKNKDGHVCGCRWTATSGRAFPHHPLHPPAPHPRHPSLYLSHLGTPLGKVCRAGVPCPMRVRGGGWREWVGVGERKGAGGSGCCVRDWRNGCAWMSLRWLLKVFFFGLWGVQFGCVCVCVCERERERERYVNTESHTHSLAHAYTHTYTQWLCCYPLAARLRTR